MATFNAFSNTLPDPAHPITDAGNQDASGTPGPGFSALSFQSVTDTQVSRTVSGRGIQRDGGSQHWEFTISYNPMFRYQFDPINTFLLGRNPRRDPFYVVLPQYSRPKDPLFAAWPYTQSGAVGVETAEAGSSQIIMYTGEDQFGNGGTPKPGDVFNIRDPNDFNHQKAYMVTGVETSSYYQAGTVAPTTSQVRVHISPPLQRYVQGGSLVTFIDPKFRVIAKSDVLEYSLNTDNLYSFSLALEEIQA